MLSQRNTHYWLWFLLFGVVSALVTASQGEGHHHRDDVAAHRWLRRAGAGHVPAALARPFDLVIGLLFTAVGLLGILHNFGLNLVASRAVSRPTRLMRRRFLG